VIGASMGLPGCDGVKGGLGKEPAPLLHAPELAAGKTGQTVFLVGGEKCAQRLAEAGLLATTAQEGAGKFGKVGGKTPILQWFERDCGFCGSLSGKDKSGATDPTRLELPTHNETPPKPKVELSD